MQGKATKSLVEMRFVIGVSLALALVAPVLLAAPGAADDPVEDVLRLVTDTACGIPPVGNALCEPGAEAWVARYDGGAGHDWVAALDVSPDGTRTYVTGQSPGLTTGSDYATVAIDTLTGVQLWAARHDGPSSGFDVAKDLRVSPLGTQVFVTGYTTGPTGHDYTTISYNAATGIPSWASTYNSGGGDQAEAIAVSADGARVYVTGQSQGDHATVAYAADTGAELWVARYKGPVDGWEGAKAIGVSPDGTRVFVTGFSPGIGTDLDYVTNAYDAEDGTLVWTARYDGPGNSDDIPWSLDLSPDGERVFVTGLSAGAGTGIADYATVAYNAADGTESWVARYDGPASGYDVAWMVRASPDGDRVYVTGFSDGIGTGQDYATLAYDAADGSEVWAVRYEAAGRDVANAIGISPDGSTVYVSGESGQPPFGNDFLTIAYAAADGTEKWQAKYDGPGTGDIAQAVSTGPSGLRVFVAGTSQGITGSWDYAVVAYETGLL